MSQRLTLPTDLSEDARNRFASLLPESKVDDPEKHPSFVSPHQIWPAK
jgi:hypothetical protein